MSLLKHFRKFDLTASWKYQNIECHQENYFEGLSDEECNQASDQIKLLTNEEMGELSDALDILKDSNDIMARLSAVEVTVWFDVVAPLLRVQVTALSDQDCTDELDRSVEEKVGEIVQIHVSNLAGAIDGEMMPEVAEPA